MHLGFAKNIVYVAVVEDDASVSRSFSRVLRATGFQPVTYASAEALPYPEPVAAARQTIATFRQYFRSEEASRGLTPPEYGTGNSEVPALRGLTPPARLET